MSNLTSSDLYIGCPVYHIKSRKEGIIISIDNGLAEIELTGELYKDSKTKYTHLCLIENLVKQ